MTQNKVVIYTAIAGEEDNLTQHQYKSPGFDYVCFSDRPIKNSGIWEIRQMQDSLLDNVRKAKYYKLFPHNLFPEYIYSVWVDGNINILDDKLEKRIYELINHNVSMAANKHPQRDCAYEEANACMEMKKDDPQVILRQVDFMESNGFPPDLGLYALMIIFRKHNNDEIMRFMNQWWWMIKNFSRRDQISFMYILYKNNTKMDFIFEQDIYNDSAFSFKRHSVSFYSKLMADTGNGFNYKSMVIKQFTAQTETTLDLIFDLKVASKVKRLRLVPFHTGVGRIKLKEIVLQGFDDQFEKIDLQKLKHNGFMQSDGFITFRTFNPFFEIIVDKQIRKVIISGIFNVENSLVSEKIISKEIEKMHTPLLFSWKLLRKLASLIFRARNAKST